MKWLKKLTKHAKNTQKCKHVFKICKNAAKECNNEKKCKQICVQNKKNSTTVKNLHGQCPERPDLFHLWQDEMFPMIFSQLQRKRCFKKLVLFLFSSTNNMRDWLEKFLRLSRAHHVLLLKQGESLGEGWEGRRREVKVVKFKLWRGRERYKVSKEVVKLKLWRGRERYKVSKKKNEDAYFGLGQMRGPAMEAGQ